MILGAATLVAAAVLGWGAWQASRHADVWLQVKDHAGRTPHQLWVDLHDAQIVLRDEAGRTLAEATLAPPHGLPRYTGPPGAVDCLAAQSRGGSAYSDCIDAQSCWMASWAPRVVNAKVVAGRCVVEAARVDSKLYTSWWLWWVPLPHVGGTPINHYTMQVHLDSARCAAVTAP